MNTTTQLLHVWLEIKRHVCMYVRIELQKVVSAIVQGDSVARGPKQIWEKYSRIWRNAFKCAQM